MSEENVEILQVAVDKVVAPHTTHIRDRDGIEARARPTWLVRFRAGKIERVRLSQVRSEALEDAELEE